MKSMTAEQIRDATLMLRRPTIVEKLREQLPYNKSGIPKNGLPCWDFMRLSEKLPIIEHPKDAFNFSKNKIAKEIWERPQGMPFRLDDPNCREVQYDYDLLHDPHLTNLMRSKGMQKNFIERGFVTPEMNVVCSLKEFNKFRKYLNSNYRTMINAAYEQMVNNIMDAQVIARARRCEEKRAQVLKKQKEKQKNVELAIKKREDDRKMKLKTIEDQRKRYLIVLQRVETAKSEARMLAIKQAQEKDAKVRSRLTAAEEQRRAKMIATIQAWNRNDKERSMKMERQKKQLQEYKEQSVKNRWEAKIRAQSERLERDRRLLTRKEQANKLRVELRQKEYETAQLRMDALLKRAKGSRRRNRSRFGSLRRKGRAVSCSSLRRQRRSHAKDVANGVPMSEPLNHAKKISMSLHAVKIAKENHGDLNNLWRLFRDTGFDVNETRNGIPEVVAVAVDALLDATIQAAVHQKVLHSLKAVYHRALRDCLNLMEEYEQQKTASAHAHFTKQVRAKQADDREQMSRLQERIQAVKHKNELLQKELESSKRVRIAGSKKKDAEDELDIDDNCVIMECHLRKKIVELASQSINENTKIYTIHRWKLMKEVELSELIERLCSMIMLETPSQFLSSPGFYWAADILARDVMKEVRIQYRQEQKDRAKAKQQEEEEGLEQQEEKEEEEAAAPSESPPTKPEEQASQVEEEPSQELPASEYSKELLVPQEEVLPPLDPSQVPLLRLHKRSAHQPSLPSLQDFNPSK